MGARNVSAAYVMWPHLPHRAFRLLAGMANTALDDDVDGRPARRYFGGERSMAELIGEVPADADRNASIFRSARAALRELIDAGAIVRLTTGRRGSRAEFTLNLDPLTAATKRERQIPASAGMPRSPTAGTSRSRAGGTSRSHPGTTPRTTEESDGGAWRGRPETPVQTARAKLGNAPDLAAYPFAKERMERSLGALVTSELVLAAVEAEPGLDPRVATIRLAATLDMTKSAA